MKTYKALTVKQPWAHLIVTGIKPIENRTWNTPYRGHLLIHAGRVFDEDQQYWQTREGLTFGAIIGAVDLVDVVREHPSHFFTGPYGWVLKNPRRIDPMTRRARVGLFDAEFDRVTYRRNQFKAG